MDDVSRKWENKILTVCTKCRQNLRLPISYTSLHVTCPKCKNEFLYNYLSEFGQGGEYYTRVQIQWALLLLSTIMLYLVSFVLSLAIQNLFVALICIVVGILIIPKLIDYRTFLKYRPIKLLVINRQGLIYFDKELTAQECLNWSDIKSAKYIFTRHLFAGLVETKRTPARIELDMGDKGKVIVPPVMFFSGAQRLKIIDEVLGHYGTNSVLGMYYSE